MKFNVRKAAAGQQGFIFCPAVGLHAGGVPGYSAAGGINDKVPAYGNGLVGIPEILLQVEMGFSEKSPLSAADHVAGAWPARRTASKVWASIRSEPPEVKAGGPFGE